MLDRGPESLRRKAHFATAARTRTRALSNPKVMAAIVGTFRRSHADRFQGAQDWLRFVILGGLLLTFSSLALASVISRDPLFDDLPGGPAIFGGTIVMIMIIKISSGRLYVDWLLSGALYVGVGFSQHLAETRGAAWPLLFCVLMAASGLSRIWIGMTTQGVAGYWPRYSGYVALLAAFAAVAAYLFGMPIRLGSLCAVDLLFQGLAMAGYGIALRPPRDYGKIL